MSERWILIEQDSGLHVGWYFWLRVLDEVNRSARYGGPFGLLLLEADAVDAGGRHAAESAIALVPAAIRGTDMGGRLGPNRAGVVLMNQDRAGAQTASERVLERIAAAGGQGVRWHTGLFMYPDDGGEISTLLTAGWQPDDMLLRRPA